MKKIEKPAWSLRELCADFFILDEILLAECVMSRYEQVTQAKPETSR